MKLQQILRGLSQTNFLWTDTKAQGKKSLISPFHLSIFIQYVSYTYGNMSSGNIHIPINRENTCIYKNCIILTYAVCSSASGPPALFYAPHGLKHQASPVPHHLPKFGTVQVHVHCIGDAIHPSHSLMPSPSTLSLPQHQGKNEVQMPPFPVSLLFTSGSHSTHNSFNYVKAQEIFATKYSLN